MKKILIVLVLLALSSDLFAGWWNKKKEEEPVKVPDPVPIVVKEPEFCNYSLDIGEGVFFVFKGKCTNLIHEGIVDTVNNKIIILDETGAKLHSSDFENQEARYKYTEKKWSSIVPINFYLVK